METKKMGKYVCMLLRHHPEEAGIVLDEHGWTDVEELIEKVQAKYPLTEELLHEIAFAPDKQRFEFSENGKRVRAVHGHSVPVDLGYAEEMPPDVLYHGSAEKYRESIRELGLIKKDRLFVHLSEKIETAKEVGKRHGKLVLYTVDARKMHEDGYIFYKSVSGVWLTDSVSPAYLKEIE